MERPATRRSSGVDIEPVFRIEPGRLSWDPTTVEPSAEDILVTAAFRFLTANGALSYDAGRELGRALGQVVPTDDVEEYVRALAHLGVGRMALVAGEGGRYTFSAEGLVNAERVRSPACGLALGFAEGIVRALEGREALGAEMSCRSRGAASCTFVVIARP